MPKPPNLPRNFLDEVETALLETQTAIDNGKARLTELEELHHLARRLSYQLDRPVTVFDIIQTAHDQTDKAHRQTLIRTLRDHHPDSRPGAGSTLI